MGEGSLVQAVNLNKGLRYTKTVWLQHWLGETYSKLHWEFGRESFSLSDAEQVLGFGESKVHVAFSKLHSCGALIVFRRSRPRIYRLLDPGSLILRASGKINEVDFQQEEYLQLALDVLRTLRARLDLVSFCVYGSVARGEARSSSDLDVLVVSDDFNGSVASRIDLLSFVDSEVGEELAYLRKNGLSTYVSFMPLRKEEVEAGPILLLDQSYNAKILYDEGDFLGRILARLRAKLELKGSKRIKTSGGWYWDLQPDFSQGQAVEI
jgi:predicted nucleotidyltransferase